MAISELILSAVISTFASNGLEVDRSELRCMAENIFFEARGEDVSEHIRVANVTMNRKHNARWPGSVCGVVHQPWQFSWTLDKKLAKSLEAKLQQNAGYADLYHGIVETAAHVMVGNINDYTNGATHYHRLDVNPRWAKDLDVSWEGNSIHKYYKES